MATRDEFVDHLLDLMSDLGRVSAKRMFGGYGIYRGDVMFGLVAFQTLYLKVDAQNRAEFEAEGLGPFVYTGKSGGKPIQMSYYQAPEAALESPAVMIEWATSALAAARRSGTKSKKKSSKKKAAAKKKAAGKKTSTKQAARKKKTVRQKSAR